MTDLVTDKPEKTDKQTQFTESVWLNTYNDLTFLLCKK